MLVDDESFLIVADRSDQNIFRLDCGGKTSLLPRFLTTNPIGLAFDSVNNEIFWTDSDKHLIAKYSIAIRSVKVLMEDEIGKLI